MNQLNNKGNDNEVMKINVNIYNKENEDNQNIINNINLHKDIDKVTSEAEKNEILNKTKLGINNKTNESEKNQNKIKEENDI